MHQVRDASDPLPGMQTQKEGGSFQNMEKLERKKAAHSGGHVNEKGRLDRVCSALNKLLYLRENPPQSEKEMLLKSLFSYICKKVRHLSYDRVKEKGVRD